MVCYNSLENNTRGCEGVFMNYVIVNKLTKKTNQEDRLAAVLNLVPDEKTVLNANETDYAALADGLEPEDALYFAGGDGTLNYFLNQIDPDALQNDLFFYSMGSGNDFFRDMGFHDTFVRMNPYIKNLPTVSTAFYDKRYFLGAGLGLDGATVFYSETDGKKKNKNFTRGAVKAFFCFKPYNATVVFDGESRHFEKIYLASVMKGSCIGSGMLLAPDQNRNDPDGKLTLVVVHSKTKIGSFFALLKLLTKNTNRSDKHFFVRTGNNFEVHADRDSYLFMDGETCPLGKDYTVTTSVRERVNN